MEDKSKFVRVSGTNKSELARLLIEAKGPRRTMKQFAEECGVHPSTFSRIANKAIRGASSDELIKSIAEHADPESKVTLDALMGAHGMARVLDSSTVYRASVTELEKSFEHTILCELGQLNDIISYSMDAIFNVSVTFRFRPDMVVRSRSLEGNGSLWAFDLFFPQMPVQEGQVKQETNHSTRMYGRHILEMIGRVLPLFYSQENNREILGKISFVTTDKMCFDYAVSEFADYRVPFNMSFILFDSYKEAIIQEYVLKQPDGSVQGSVINGNR